MKRNILDAHMHLPYDCKSFADKRSTLLKEMQTNQITKGIVISDSSLESTIGSLQECVELFAHDEHIAIVGGISPFFTYEKQLRLLEKYLQEKRVVGIKLFCGHEQFYLYDERLLPVYDLARTYQVPILYHSEGHTSPYASLASTQMAVKQHPDITFVCCHCHYPDVADCFVAYEDTTNMIFDMSSLADQWIYLPSMKKEIEKFLYKHPNRIMFGSDYAGCNQLDHLQFALSLAMDEQTKNKLLYETACKVYKI